MNRIIKFRAWDKINKGMLQNVPISKDGRCAISSEDIFELMQFTGLLDSEGHEIYDGDILSGLLDGFVNKKNRSHPVMKKFVVEWRNCGWVVVGNDSNGNKGLARSLCSAAQESPLNIIGNIYENQELLN